MKYAKIINDGTKKVSVILGNANADFIKDNGYTLQDVEQSDIDNDWYLKGFAPMKTDEDKLIEAKQNKIAENEQKRQVEFINTHLGKLKTETPLGDLKTALPLYTVIATANNGLPENAVRIYVDGVPKGSPALTLEQFNQLIGEIAMEYVKIDQYSTQLTIAINKTKSKKELDLIVIDYDNMPDLKNRIVTANS